MIIFHFFFLLDFLEIRNYEMYEGGFLLLARFVQFSFLILVGVCMAISYNKIRAKGISKNAFYFRQWNRSKIILLSAIFVTLATRIFIGDLYVRFGVLHFIAVSSYFLSFFVEKKKTLKIIALIGFGLGKIFQEVETSFPLLLIFGFKVQNFQTIDYFPIFPWITLPTLGILLGHFLYPGGKRRWKNSEKISRITPKIFQFFSKYALVIYLLHIPLLYGLIEFFKKITVE